MSNPIVESSGSLTASGAGTADIVATLSIPRTFIFTVSLSNLALGDTVVLSIKRKVLSGGALVEFFREAFTGVQDPPGAVSVPMFSPHQASFVITQLSGTPKVFDWSVESA